MGQRLICASNLRQIGQALESYQITHDGYGPFLGQDPIDPSTGYLRETPEQMLSIDLSDGWGIWKCPSDKNKPRAVWFGPNWFTCPPHLTEEMCNISYVWSEPFLRGFYEGHPEAKGRPWTQKPYHYFKGPILADGDRMLNVWDWREALWWDYPLNSLDQSHCGHKYHQVNLLFSEGYVENIICDKDMLDSCLPW